MHVSKGSVLFACVLVCAAAFVWLTSVRLPTLVASHFGSSGAATGFMRYGFYVCFMLAFVVGLPPLLVVTTWLALSGKKARINLPNKAYWWAPERRAETIAFLRSGILWFATTLVAFLCYVHWLVVVANEVQPAHLANSWFVGGLVGFLAGVFIWLKVFLGRFRRSA